MSESSPPGKRLDSWKAIAQYLQRDLATVRRWEKLLGLPIHRVGLTGRSVFAYVREIDEWLATKRPALAPPEIPAPAAAPVKAKRESPQRRLVLIGTVLAALALVVVAAANVSRARRVTPQNLRAELTTAGVLARDKAGVERWNYRFPQGYATQVDPQQVRISGGAQPGVYFATSYRGRGTNEQAESGSLTLLDLDGHPLRSFSFGDSVTFDGTSYGPPWMVTAFAVSDANGERRVAVAAHHFVWDPGLLTILDDQFRRRGTYVNAGWIEAVQWLGPDRLVIGGFSNAHDGGMIALLDAAALNGQSPEAAPSRHFCQNCGSGKPLRMFVFPRTEVNRASSSRFNRAQIQTFSGGRVLVHTIEMTGRPADAGDAEAIYEFKTQGLEFVSAKFSDRYWEMHRALEAEGKIKHTREQCPDRDGPRQIEAWEASTGWRTVHIR